MITEPSEQERAAVAALEDMLGEHPAEFATAGELATLMARLPADTPVHVARYTRVDPAFDWDGHAEERLAAAARVVTDLHDQRVETDEQGWQRLGGRHIPVVELGAVIVAEGVPVPPHTAAFEPADRALEAIHAYDPVAVLDAYRELVIDIAGVLDGSLDASLYDLLDDDPDLCEQLRLEGNRLSHTAARLAQLRTLVAAYQGERDQPDR